MELRAMKDILDARKAEIEATADEIIVDKPTYGIFGVISGFEHKFVGKDEALQAMQSTITALSSEVQKNDPAKISRTFFARIRFLFTGNITKVNGYPECDS